MKDILHVLIGQKFVKGFRLLDIGKVAGGEAANGHIRHGVFSAAVGIDRRAAIGGVLDVGMFQKVILFIHQRRFATDKEQGQVIVQHTDLIGRHQLPARDLVVGGVAAGMPGALAVGVQPEGAFPQVVLRDQLVSGRFIAAQVQKFITVADDGFPLLFKQRLELGNVLDDDRNTDIPGAHGSQQLVEIIRQAHVGELIHEKMHRYGQATAVYPVGRIKKFLEGAGIQQAYQEIEAGVVVRDQRKKRHFFLAQAGKVQFIRGGEGRHRGKIEFFQAGRQGDLNGFQRFSRAGTIILVILHGDVVRGAHFQPVKQLIQGGLVGIIVLPYLPGSEHLHNHGEILLVLRRFVPQIKHQRHEEHTGRRVPERVVGLAPFRGSGFEQVRHHLLYIIVGFQIGKGIIAVTFLHVQKVHHLDLIAHPFQQAAAVTKQFPLTVQNKKGRIALADVHFGIEAAFSRATAAHHQSVEVAAVLPAIQPHADVLGENAVFERVLVPVFLIHGPRIAPFGGTVFFASAVITP